MDAPEPADPGQVHEADEAREAHEADEPAPDSATDNLPEDRPDDVPDDLSIDMTDELIALLGGDNPFSTGGSTGGARGGPAPAANHVDPPSAHALDLTAVQLDSADPTGPGFLPATRVRRPVRWWVRRLVSSAVLVALAVGVGAVLTAHDLPGWVVGLAVGLIAVAGSAATRFESARSRSRSRSR